jgi:translocation and assembly module TamA
MTPNRSILRSAVQIPFKVAFRLQLAVSIMMFCLTLSPAYGQESGSFFEVIIKGVEGEVLKNVQMALTVPEGMIKDKEIDESLLGIFIREAPQRIQEALQPFGFYHGQVHLEMERPDGRFRLLAIIHPGEGVRLESVKFTIQGPGAKNERLLNSLPPCPLKERELLRQDLYEEFKTALKDKASESGYLDAGFPVHLIRLSLEKNTAQVELVLDTGQQYYFGEITFDAPADYPESFLKRYLTFQTGRVFNPQNLARSQMNLINSDRFREVSVETDKDGAKDYQIPVRIRLSLAKPKRFKVGVSYETDQGLGVLARYKDLNVFQGGQELSSELRISERLQGWAVDYILPRADRIEDKIIFKGGYKREITDTYDTRSIFARSEYEHIFGRGRLGAAYLHFLREDFSISKQQGLSSMVLPGARFERRRFDHPVQPSTGYRYSLEARGSTPILGSDNSFIQLLGQGNTMAPLGKGFSLLLRAQGGMTLENDSLTNLPPSLRFFAGGDNSVRGYAYQSLGPVDNTGKVVGGKYLFVGSLEIEKSITKIWGVAAFYDAGNAFDDFKKVSLKQGAGLGIRIYTPVGPLKLDLARQIGEDNPQFRFHFTIGFSL